MQTNEKKQRPKNWQIRHELSMPYDAPVAAISRQFLLSDIVAQLLYLRGFKTIEQAESFLLMTQERLYDPKIMKGIPSAVKRIRRAIENGERITIYGDYDVDGVTSVSCLYLYLKSKGADVSYYIPNRISDGYGVTKPVISSLRDEGTKLIISVDTGITANEEVDYANSLGVDFIVTDHHECLESIPNAVSVVNPHQPDCPYPFKDLAGVGVVFKLLCALEESIERVSLSDAVRTIFVDYADLVAIGTIADVMPVRDENRIIIKYGLAMLENHPRPGIVALIDAINDSSDYQVKPKRKTKFTTSYIGFSIAPKINAAGRILSASIAVELFLQDDYASAKSYADQLCEANKLRQNEENKIVNEAYDLISKQCDLENDFVLVLDSDHWHHGVIGIVSSRITESYGLPSILVSFEGASPDDPDPVGKGSGRSVKGLNLVDALVDVSDILVKFGGHELAAGLSVTKSNLPLFRQRINEYAKSHLKDEDLVQTIDVDMELAPEDITLDLCEDVRKLEPFGVSNLNPIFALRDVSISDITGVSANKHTKLSFVKDGKFLNAMYFSHSPMDVNLFVGDKVDILFHLEINEFNGRRTPQILIKDIRFSEEQQKEMDSEMESLKQILAGESFSSDDVIPTREDFAAVYKAIRKCVRYEEDAQTVRSLQQKLSQHQVDMNYVKIKLVLKVFQELNIVGMEELSEDYYRFKMLSFDQKIDLEKSYLLKKIRMQKKEI